MKIIVSLVLLIPVLLNGQIESPLFSTKNSIRMSVFEFGKAEFQISYERYFNDRKSSLSIKPSVILKNDNDSQKEGWSLAGQYRFYLTHYNKQQTKTFLGFENYALYTGLYVSYLDFGEDYTLYNWDEISNSQVRENHRKDISATEGGVIAGIQINFSTRVLVDLFFGGGIKKTNIIDSYDDSSSEYPQYNYYGVFDREYEGVKPRVGFQVGFSF